MATRIFTRKVPFWRVMCFGAVLTGLILYMLATSVQTTNMEIRQVSRPVSAGLYVEPVESKQEQPFKIPEAYTYPDKVDIRFIVLTMDRAQSLQVTLNSLQHIELDGRKGAVEIFVDRYKNGSVHSATVTTAIQFQWFHGPSKVHIREEHAGLYSQWIDTWAPEPDSGELAIFIEDDVDVSKYSYRWLRQVHNNLGHKEFISGYCLQDSNAKIAIGQSIDKEVNEINSAQLKPYPAYYYKVAGSWGFAPHPRQWVKFRKWFYSDARKIRHPYVEKVKLNTMWYKEFENQKRTDTMWTMWFIYFTDHFNLNALYSNIPLHTGNRKNSLVCNRMETGLHYKDKRRECDDQLMQVWSANFTNFDRVPLVKYNGQVSKLM